MQMPDSSVTTVIITALSLGIVQIINAVSNYKMRQESKDGDKKILDVCGVAADKADVAAKHSLVTAKKAEATDNKLEEISIKTTEAAANVNGNLDKVRKELANQVLENKALSAANKVLIEILSQRVRAEDRINLLERSMDLKEN